MSVSMVELLPRGIALSDLPEEHQHNLNELLPKLQVLREISKRIFIVSSGYRTIEHHEEIYRIKNELRMKAGLMPVPIPMGSKHLIGKAADIADPSMGIQHWCLDNQETLEELGIWCENFAACKFPTPWVHFQDAPASHQFFWP